MSQVDSSQPPQYVHLYRVAKDDRVTLYSELQAPLDGHESALHAFLRGDTGDLPEGWVHMDTPPQPDPDRTELPDNIGWPPEECEITWVRDSADCVWALCVLY